MKCFLICSVITTDLAAPQTTCSPSSVRRQNPPMSTTATPTLKVTERHLHFLTHLKFSNEMLNTYISAVCQLAKVTPDCLIVVRLLQVLPLHHG